MGDILEKKKGGFNCLILANMPQYGALLDMRYDLCEELIFACST